MPQEDQISYQWDIFGHYFWSETIVNNKVEPGDCL